MKRALQLLTLRERRELVFLTLAVLVTALLEVVGIVSVMPFMAVVGNQSLVHSNPALASLYSMFGFSTERAFLFFLGAAALAMLIVGNLISAASSLWQLRFANRCANSLAERLLAKYLGMDYEFYLNKNGADIAKNIWYEVYRVIGGLVIPGLQIVTKAFVVALILVMLVAVNPALALAIGAVLGLAYLAIYRALRERLKRIGEDSSRDIALAYKALGEAIGGIKDVKILGREGNFFSRFSAPSRMASQSSAAQQAMAMFPRYMLESVAFGGILLLTMYLIAVDSDLGRVLPVLGLYAFAAYRLMPALQQIFGNLTQIRFNTPALDELLKDLEHAPDLSTFRLPVDGESPLGLGVAFEMSGITYCYPEATRPALRGIDLRVERNTLVGLVGATGSGKTTCVDLMLGLLSPQAGELRVDGRVLCEADMRAWRRSIGYVSQQIFLTDDTVARNIAFGLDEAQIDMEAVKRAARIANIDGFIEGEMQSGYNTVVGERGIRLSGGQRQRIGIARALYHDPALLILDEATSALDNLTETAVMEAIDRLAGRKTIVVVAHRLSTVRDCDRIFMFDKGAIIASGSYAELLAGSDAFRKLAAGAVDPPAPGVP